MNNTFNLMSIDSMSKKQLREEIMRLRSELHGEKIKISKLKLQMTLDQKDIQKSYANLSIGK